MITAGIDVGVEYTRIVILKDGKTIGRSFDESGGAGRAAVVERLWGQALSEAGLTASDVDKVVVTGKGKHRIEVADEQVTEPLAACLAAQHLCPGATAVMDVGADETLVATIKNKVIGEFAINEKCAAGIGKLLDYMGRRLELTADEMSGLERPGPDAAVVNDGCAVFAEMDALGLLNRGISPRGVAIAVTEAAAIRAANVLADITIPRYDQVALVGGVANNAAFAHALKANTGIDFVVPEAPEYAGALGAALFAAGLVDDSTKEGAQV
jgi:predicted CoA-substrate-specific enzyme activase